MSNNPLYGQIPEFYGEGDDWNVYYERLEQFFTVNDIPEDKRSAFLISVIGSYTYKTLRDLCHPELPKEKSFNELCELLQRQFTPQVSVYRERSKFYNAQQEPHENVTSWFARVKKLAVDCKFGANLEAVLLDKFIIGLRSGPILDRLCEENERITLKEALDIAVNKESALAVELPPVPLPAGCYECCVPPPAQETDEQQEEANDDNHVQEPENNNEDIPRPVSSLAGDSGFREPQIAICPARRDSFFQRSREALYAQNMGGGPANDAPRLVRRPSKALVGKPIGHPMSEMPSRAPMQEMCADGNAPPPMAMACRAPPMAKACRAPPMEMACRAPPMEMACMSAPQSAPQIEIAPKMMMKKTMVQKENVTEFPEMINDLDGAEIGEPTEEKKKKTRRGCRGGRKTKK